MKELNEHLENEVDEEYESDSDICDKDEIDKLFTNCESTSETVVTSDFILHVDSTKETNPHVVVATAEKSCILYSIQNNQVAKIIEYNDYNEKLIGCKFSYIDPNLFYIGSSNGVIQLLDLRTPQKEAVNFKDTTVEDGKFKTFNCFDISSDDRLLTAGTDVIDGDAYIVFWDTRKHDLLGGYWEAHTDDVTQVKFQPGDRNKLISGSTDGLINIYDLTHDNEDDALLDTLNTESSIEELLWFDKKKKSVISCITHTSDLQLWNIDDGEPYKTFSRLDISNKMMKKREHYVYLAKCHELKDGLLVLAGSNFADGETLRGLKVTNNNFEPYIQFKSNKQRIRASSYNKNTNLLITGGEKGLLNVWKIPSI